MGRMKDLIGDETFEERTEAYARAYDKQTSHQAAESVRMGEMEQLVYDLIVAGPETGMTKDEVHLASLKAGYRHERDSIGPRFAPLERKQLIFPIGERQAKSGRKQTVYLDKTRFLQRATS